MDSLEDYVTMNFGGKADITSHPALTELSVGNERDDIRDSIVKGIDGMQVHLLALLRTCDALAIQSTTAESRIESWGRSVGHLNTDEYWKKKEIPIGIRQLSVRLNELMGRLSGTAASGSFLHNQSRLLAAEIYSLRHRRPGSCSMTVLATGLCASYGALIQFTYAFAQTRLRLAYAFARTRLLPLLNTYGAYGV